MPGRLLLDALLILGLAAATPAQVSETDPRADPRDGPDPREGVDPRTSTDPRDGAEDPRAALEGRELYESLYEAGEDSLLMDALRADAWWVAPYIEQQCLDWLRMAEREGDRTDTGNEELDALQHKARKLARLADQAIRDTRFTAHVENLLGWDAAQQTRFREGRSEYAQGRLVLSEAFNAQDALDALSPLHRAFDVSRELGDSWGQAVALLAIGRVQVLGDRGPEARETLRLAAHYAREVRDLDTVWESLSFAYESAMASRSWDEAQEALQDQYIISLEVGDRNVAARILQQLLDLDVYRVTRPEDGAPTVPGVQQPRGDDESGA